ncbi:M23 family metallopeptidase [Salinicoccus albus]|uniref:M23 family metallopeptidase n=1 Tax=Salinicoccus albus TaxID=418756 RepID=UPI0003608257|nr:M23 family metallopeptidase [Salinicoccus albus]
MVEGRIFPEEFGYHFSQENFEQIYLQTVNDFRLSMGVDDFINAAQNFNEGTGAFRLKRTNSLEPGIKRYQWVDDESGRMIITAFNSEGEIIGIQFDIHESFNSDREITINSYRMPFTGEWFVLWGGNDSFLNYHYPHPHQRYAYDFIRKSAGRAFDGDEYNLASYHAFGSDVVAPRKGKVVHVIKSVEDNKPHSMNMVSPEGNCIIIAHGYNEYSMLAHLREHSISVETGEEIAAGQMIGQCGNSGASDTPHLHFHVMNGEDPYESDSIRIQFADTREPRQGDTIKGRGAV